MISINKFNQLTTIGTSGAATLIDRVLNIDRKSVV